MPGTIHVEKIGHHVSLLTIDNPPANAMDAAMLGKLLEEFQAINDASSARAIILTGSGNSFCAGADLKAKGGEALSAFGRLLTAVESSPVPVIAAINGWCIGGGFELALCCDIRIASADARFVCAGVNMGLMASAYRLPRLIGVARAKAMLLTGSAFDALAVETLRRDHPDRATGSITNSRKKLGDAYRVSCTTIGRSHQTGSLSRYGFGSDSHA